MALISTISELRSSVHSALTTNTKDKQNEDMFLRILEDLSAAGGEVAKNAALIVEVAKQKVSGAPMDDRTMMMERMIQLVSKLPETSFARKKVTGILVDELWDSLQHPPLSYVGDKYQHRQPDGSHNNIMYPDLGKAGTPYARTVRSETKGNGAQPDPGLLFDLLMCRDSGFETNPAGISSMLLYHASIITHDVFNTSRTDANYSATSSYLDLAPLYGSSKEELKLVRKFIGGELKPDTFSEKRLLAFPPGVNVILVMYSRFHNYVARTLAAINQGGRFDPPRGLDPEQAARKVDEEIFQVARLVTNGLYINISLHDYLRGIANVPASESSWTLDPRVEINKVFDKGGVPKGVGNQVSCEFNLLYRFHSAISERDEEWTEDFFKQLFPGKDLSKLDMGSLFQGIKAFESQVPKDPSQREFGGMKRGQDGTFPDDELVEILRGSIEDPAGRFGANHVPRLLRPVEILGIMQARRWQCASLNEFRAFFKLARYTKFTDINPDPYVSSTLKNLYGHVDNVEMYPGMFLEATKPRMDPGMGLCAPYTVTRAVFSDAITLVRGDRFLTLDYTPANLTNWGITEVDTDSGTLGGAKMAHLILNAFPRHFKFNSVYAMQPFYTPAENKTIFTRHKTTHLYDFDPPAPQSPIIPVTSHKALREVLADKNNFKVPWGARMASLESYMLAGDSDANGQQREEVKQLLYGPDGAVASFAAYTEEIALKLIKENSYLLGKAGVHQVDIVKDIGNFAALRFAASLCALPLLGTYSTVDYTEPALYKVLCDLTAYVFSDADPTKSWVKRRDSQKGTAKLCAEMEKLVAAIPRIATESACPVPAGGRGYQPKTRLGGVLKSRISTRAEQAKTLVGGVGASVTQGGGGLENWGKTMAGKLKGNGKSDREVAEILVGTASAFVANTGCAFAQLIDFYLSDENKSHWDEIVRLSSLRTTEADATLTKYVLEGFRLSNSLGLFRNVEPSSGSTVTIASGPSPVTCRKGDRVFVSFVAASRDPSVFPDPLKVKLDRPAESYITFGEGPHQCLGKDINIIHSLTLLKVVARLKGLRRMPGPEGQLKYINKPGGIKLYMTPDWSQFTPYPTTMKLMFDGAP